MSETVTYERTKDEELRAKGYEWQATLACGDILYGTTLTDVQAHAARVMENIRKGYAPDLFGGPVKYAGKDEE
jgi:hypothetical protein